jgi:hypothetical protein
VTTYQPGSFFLAAAEGWAGYGIALGQTLAGDPSRYTHAGIIIGSDGTCVEAEPGGARYGNVTHYRHTLVSDAPVREVVGDWMHPAVETEQRIRLAVTAEAHKLIGVGYSFLDYFALAALHLHLPSGWVRRRVEKSGHMICSQLCDAVFDRAGIHLFTDGRLPGDVMPSDLAAWAEDHEVQS